MPDGNSGYYMIDCGFELREGEGSAKGIQKRPDETDKCDAYTPYKGFSSNRKCVTCEHFVGMYRITGKFVRKNRIPFSYSGFDEIFLFPPAKLEA